MDKIKRLLIAILMVCFIAGMTLSVTGCGEKEEAEETEEAAEEVVEEEAAE